MSGSDPSIPWYRRSKAEQPFRFLQTISENASESATDAKPFFCTAVFPWRKDALDGHLYRGVDAHNEQLQSDWKVMVEKWQGGILVGSTGCFHVFHRLGCHGELTVTIPPPPDWQYAWNVTAIAWAIAPQNPTNPVAIAAIASVLFIYDLNAREVIGRVRGHGGAITCVAVHPTEPYQFLTTSEDGSTRIHDLHYYCRQRPNNPHWPPAPANRPSLAGPAFGLHASEPEGEGLGRCLAVLVGSLSGGHYGTVFHGTWHPSADLIATCGMDRCVKIWRVPLIDYAKVDVDQEHLAREDKPLFSSDYIHKSRILSVTWLSSDVLVSHCAPALMRGSTIDDMYEIPGTITVWMWLGFGRYLPNGRVTRVMRGNLSDFRRSASLKVLAEYSLPMNNRIATYAELFQDPLVLLDDGGDRLRIFAISEFKPRPPPPFPLDVQDEEEVEQEVNPPSSRGNTSMSNRDTPTSHRNTPASQRNTPIDDSERLGLGENQPNVEEEDDDDQWDDPPIVYKRQPMPLTLVDNVEHWTVPKLPVNVTHVGDSGMSLGPDRCQWAVGSRIIVTASEKGSLSLYKLSAP